MKKKADQYFDNEEYTKAFVLYQTLLSNYRDNPEYNFRFGVCLMYSDKADKSKPIIYLEKAAKYPEIDKRLFYFLGLAYQQNYQFTDAIDSYKKFNEGRGNPKNDKLNVARRIEECENGLILLASVRGIYVLNKVEVKTAYFYRSYDLSFSGGKIIIVPEMLRTKLDIKQNAPMVAFYSDKMSVLYYSSYGARGENGLDIYRVYKNPDGSWQSPENMGKVVNTKYDEAFPYVTPDGKKIYFSSTGHNSMGGFDLFYSSFDLANFTWEKPINLNFPINTPFDDLLFVPDTTNKFAYFSSDRTSIENLVNVYQVGLNKRPDEVMNLAKVYRSTDPKLGIKEIKNMATLNTNVQVDQYNSDIPESSAPFLDNEILNQKIDSNALKLTGDAKFPYSKGKVIDSVYASIEAIKAHESYLMKRRDIIGRISTAYKKDAVKAKASFGPESPEYTGIVAEYKKADTISEKILSEIQGNREVLQLMLDLTGDLLKYGSVENLDSLYSVFGKSNKFYSKSSKKLNTGDSIIYKEYTHYNSIKSEIGVKKSEIAKLKSESKPLETAKQALEARIANAASNEEKTLIQDSLGLINNELNKQNQIISTSSKVLDELVSQEYASRETIGLIEKMMDEKALLEAKAAAAALKPVATINPNVVAGGEVVTKPVETPGQNQVQAAQNQDVSPQIAINGQNQDNGGVNVETQVVKPVENVIPNQPTFDSAAFYAEVQRKLEEEKMKQFMLSGGEMMVENPTTSNPTTANPTTQQPNTGNPELAVNQNSENSTTANPTTQQPNTGNPELAVNQNSENSTTANPTTQQPNTGNTELAVNQNPENSTTANPTTQQPNTGNPELAVNQNPENPTSANPTTQQPNTGNPELAVNQNPENPTSANPTTQQPNTGNPELAVNQNPENPTTTNPNTQQPNTGNPELAVNQNPENSSTANPTTQQPDTGNPELAVNQNPENSSTANPTTQQPDTGNPELAVNQNPENSTTANPTTQQPNTGNPELAVNQSPENPTTANPTTQQPNSGNPELAVNQNPENSTTANPTTQQPNSGNPELAVNQNPENPTTANPTTQQPNTGNPELAVNQNPENSTTANPTTQQPNSGNPELAVNQNPENPTTANPTTQQPNTGNPELAVNQNPENPTTANPTTQQPNTGNPELAVNQNPENSTTANPTTQQPNTGNPELAVNQNSENSTTANPTTQQPHTGNPELAVNQNPENSTTANPTTQQPNTGNPELAVNQNPENPTTANPTIQQPNTGNPELAVNQNPENPTTTNPNTQQPNTGNPELAVNQNPENPTTANPTTLQPNTGNPELAVNQNPENPTTTNPNTQQPDTGNPELAVNQNPENPSTANPTSENPGSQNLIEPAVIKQSLTDFVKVDHIKQRNFLNTQVQVAEGKANMLNQQIVKSSTEAQELVASISQIQAQISTTESNSEKLSLENLMQSKQELLKLQLDKIDVLQEYKDSIMYSISEVLDIISETDSLLPSINNYLANNSLENPEYFYTKGEEFRNAKLSFVSPEDLVDDVEFVKQERIDLISTRSAMSQRLIALQNQFADTSLTKERKLEIGMKINATIDSVNEVSNDIARDDYFLTRNAVLAEINSELTRENFDYQQFNNVSNRNIDFDELEMKLAEATVSAKLSIPTETKVDVNMLALEIAEASESAVAEQQQQNADARKTTDFDTPEQNEVANTYLKPLDEKLQKIESEIALSVNKVSTATALSQDYANQSLALVQQSEKIKESYESEADPEIKSELKAQYEKIIDDATQLELKGLTIKELANEEINRLEVLTKQRQEIDEKFNAFQSQIADNQVDNLNSEESLKKFNSAVSTEMPENNSSMVLSEQIDKNIGELKNQLQVIENQISAQEQRVEPLRRTYDLALAKAILEPNEAKQYKLELKATEISNQINAINSDIDSLNIAKVLVGSELSLMELKQAVLNNSTSELNSLAMQTPVVYQSNMSVPDKLAIEDELTDFTQNQGLNENQNALQPSNYVDENSIDLVYFNSLDFVAIKNMLIRKHNLLLSRKLEILRVKRSNTFDLNEKRDYTSQIAGIEEVKDSLSEVFDANSAIINSSKEKGEKLNYDENMSVDLVFSRLNNQAVEYQAKADSLKELAKISPRKQRKDLKLIASAYEMQANNFKMELVGLSSAKTIAEYTERENEILALSENVKSDAMSNQARLKVDEAKQNLIAAQELRSNAANPKLSLEEKILMQEEASKRETMAINLQSEALQIYKDNQLNNNTLASNRGTGEEVPNDVTPQQTIAETQVNIAGTQTVSEDSANTNGENVTNISPEIAEAQPDANPVNQPVEAINAVNPVDTTGVNGITQPNQGQNQQAAQTQQNAETTGQQPIQATTELQRNPEQQRDFEIRRAEKIGAYIIANQPLAALPSFYSVEKPIMNQTPESMPQGLVFKVQIAAFKNVVDPAKFKGITPISIEKIPNSQFIRYMGGMFTNLPDAIIARNQIRTIGFADAFVVAYFNGQRITIAQANAMIANGTAFTDQKLVEVAKENNIPVYESNVAQVAQQQQIPNQEIQAGDFTIPELFYTVQVGVFGGPRNYQRLNNIPEMFFDRLPNGNYRYFSGKLSTYDLAVQRRTLTRNSGFADAFIVAYYRGAKITLNQARELEGNVIMQPNNPNVQQNVPVNNQVNQNSVQNQQVNTQSQPQNIDIQPEVQPPVAQNIIYKIQLGAYRNQIPVEAVDALLRVSENGIEKLTQGDLTIYLTGSFKTFDEAKAARDRILPTIPEAFVTAFSNGEKITIDEALRLNGR